MNTIIKEKPTAARVVLKTGRGIQTAFRYGAGVVRMKTVIAVIIYGVLYEDASQVFYEGNLIAVNYE